MYGLDLTDPSNSPILVFLGLLIGQLFLYGRKVKANVRIAARELIGDAMQFATQFVGCMALLAVGKGLGWQLDSVWQVVTITIVFTMNFDQWFTKLRTAMTDRMSLAVEALLGKVPPDAVIVVPSGEGIPATLGALVLSPNASDEELILELERRGLPVSHILGRMPGVIQPEVDAEYVRRIDEAEKKAQSDRSNVPQARITFESDQSEIER